MGISLLLSTSIANANCSDWLFAYYCPLHTTANHGNPSNFTNHIMLLNDTPTSTLRRPAPSHPKLSQPPSWLGLTKLNLILMMRDFVEDPKLSTRIGAYSFASSIKLYYLCISNSYISFRRKPDPMRSEHSVAWLPWAIIFPNGSSILYFF